MQFKKKTGKQPIFLVLVCLITVGNCFVPDVQPMRHRLDRTRTIDEHTRPKAIIYRTIEKDSDSVMDNMFDRRSFRTGPIDEYRSDRRHFGAFRSDSAERRTSEERRSINRDFERESFRYYNRERDSTGDLSERDMLRRNRERDSARDSTERDMLRQNRERDSARDSTERDMLRQNRERDSARDSSERDMLRQNRERDSERGISRNVRERDSERVSERDVLRNIRERDSGRVSERDISRNNRERDSERDILQDRERDVERSSERDNGERVLEARARSTNSRQRDSQRRENKTLRERDSERDNRVTVHHQNQLRDVNLRETRRIKEQRSSRRLIRDTRRFERFDEMKREEINPDLDRRNDLRRDATGEVSRKTSEQQRLPMESFARREIRDILREKSLASRELPAIEGTSYTEMWANTIKVVLAVYLIGQIFVDTKKNKFRFQNMISPFGALDKQKVQ